MNVDNQLNEQDKLLIGKVETLLTGEADSHLVEDSLYGLCAQMASTVPRVSSDFTERLWGRFVQNDERLSAQMQGELTHKPLASRPRREYSLTLAERLHNLLHTAWGWTLPTGAVILLILFISVLMQLRPQPTIPAGPITATSMQTGLATPTSLQTSLATAIGLQASLTTPTGQPLDTEDTSSQEDSQAYPTADPEKMILPDGLKAYDNFGAALAYDENLLAVGAPSTDLDSGRNVGAVYIFKKSGDGWGQVARLTPEPVQADGRFGSTLALDSDVLVVGAPYEYNPGAGNASGAVYVFTHNKDQWSQAVRLSVPDGQPFDLFGSSLGLNTGNLAVGARSADGPNGRDTGAVYLYHRDGQDWVLQARLGEKAAAFDHFGQALAFAGDDLLIGAPDADPAQAANSGQVYIYRPTGGSWNEQARLTAEKSYAQARFGAALSVQGNRLAVVAPQEYQKTGPLPPYALAYESCIGVVHIFERKEDQWHWQTRLFPEAESDENAVWVSGVLITTVHGQARLAIRGLGRGVPFLYELRNGSWQSLPGVDLPDWYGGEGIVAAGEQVLMGSRFFDIPQPGGDAIWSGGVVWIIDW